MPSFFRILFVFFLCTLSVLGASSAYADMLPTSLEIPGNRENFHYVRVVLLKDIPEVRVEGNHPYTLKDVKGKILATGSKISPTTVSVAGDGISFGKQIFHENPLFLDSPEGIKIAKHTYRNAVIFWREPGGKLLVVNEVDLEDYIKGVIAWEASPNWPLESLEAQAIAARTYALFQAIRNQDKKFDVSKDVLSQVYKGKNVEHSRTNQAVEQTRGLVLTSNGKLFPAYYHSTCGGKTTNVEDAWRNAQPNPALVGVTCDFCKGSSNYKWKKEFSLKAIDQALRKRGLKPPPITHISIMETDPSGRAGNLLFEYGIGKVKVPAEDFRMLVGPDKIKSTLIRSIEPVGHGFVFQGKGWGHGVGMCQYGMKYLGEIGYSTKQILGFYYTGAVVTDFFKLQTTATPKTVASVPKTPQPKGEEKEESIWDRVLNVFE